MADGDADVDPMAINARGLQFDFDEPVHGTIKLTEEDGTDLNWLSNVAGQTATLSPVAGQELTYETVYVVEIDVQDGSGNIFQTRIFFVTKPME